jgi:hypothetical protein
VPDPERIFIVLLGKGKCILGDPKHQNIQYSWVDRERKSWGLRWEGSSLLNKSRSVHWNFHPDDKSWIPVSVQRTFVSLSEIIYLSFENPRVLISGARTLGK